MNTVQKGAWIRYLIKAVVLLDLASNAGLIRYLPFNSMVVITPLYVRGVLHYGGFRWPY